MKHLWFFVFAIGCTEVEQNRTPENNIVTTARGAFYFVIPDSMVKPELLEQFKNRTDLRDDIEALPEPQEDVGDPQEDIDLSWIAEPYATWIAEALEVDVENINEVILDDGSWVDDR